MQITFLTQLDWLIRLILAGVCGYAIGYERNSRSKNAGTRTHLIVALSAALMIIVSKYGFMDIISTHGVNLDPSRIAAQIVSGIGFLGAGMIFVHNQSVNGLTTAAGIWATSGIGMAIGSGLYFIGIVLQLDNIFSAQYFIPIFGILMGNMLSSNVIALNTYYSGLKREQQLYRYLLGNGATRQEAQAPFIKQAIIKSFSPLIANIAVMGLVALPGTMIGQILGGSSPNVAIKYQMMIMVITFTASMLSLMITISLASRRSFDAYGKLLEVSKEAKK